MIKHVFSGNPIWENLISDWIRNYILKLGCYSMLMDSYHYNCMTHFNHIYMINLKLRKWLKKTCWIVSFWISSGFINVFHEGGPTCITEPFLQQRLELAHIFEAEVESLEPGDGCLAEIITIEFSHRKAHIPLHTEYISTMIKRKKRQPSPEPAM